MIVGSAVQVGAFPTAGVTVGDGIGQDGCGVAGAAGAFTATPAISRVVSTWVLARCPRAGGAGPRAVLGELVRACLDVRKADIEWWEPDVACWLTH